MPTVTMRSVVTNTSTATTTKQITMPGAYAVGDLATLFYVSGSGAPDANPSGWLPLASGNNGSIYWAAWTKKLVAGDISSPTITVNTASAGKVFLAVVAGYATSHEVSPVVFAARQETTTTAVHAANAISIPGPATVISFFGVKDTVADVSAGYAGPAGLGTPVTAITTGTSQIAGGVAISTSDIAAGSFGGGTSWTVTKADGTTPAPSQNAVVLNVAYCAVIRPSGDVTIPAGATYTGGANLQAVAGDDNPATYMEFTGAGNLTFEERIGVNGVVPNFVQLDMSSTGGATATSVHGYLMLGGTQLLDLGTDSSLIGSTGRPVVFSLSALSSGQKTSILADPTNLRIRAVCTVS